MASGWELGMESWRARTLLLLKQTHGPMAGEAGCVQGCGWEHTDQAGQTLRAEWM